MKTNKINTNIPDLRIIYTITAIVISFNLFAQNDYILYEAPGYSFAYNPEKPNATWKLPKKLSEISGLACIDRNRLASIQDEKGNLYILNMLSKDITKIDFGNDGDYEGIAIVGNTAWVLKSNGTLFKISMYYNEDKLSVKKITTNLKKKNDTEGLTYDHENNRLLIACKGHPYIGDKKAKGKKAIYAFDLETETLSKKPVIKIKNDSLKIHRNYNTMTRLGVELLATINESKGDLSFQPSALAVNPLTQNLFITAAVGNLLVVTTKQGTILAIVDLKSKVHKQPEGICFDPEGNMYIANEGIEKSAKIHMFHPLNQPVR